MPSVWFSDRPDDPGSSINVRGLQDFGRVTTLVDGAQQDFQRSGHFANGQFYLDPELVGGSGCRSRSGRQYLWFRRDRWRRFVSHQGSGRHSVAGRNASGPEPRHVRNQRRSMARIDFRRRARPARRHFCRRRLSRQWQLHLGSRHPHVAPMCFKLRRLSRNRDSRQLRCSLHRKSSRLRDNQADRASRRGTSRSSSRPSLTIPATTSEIRPARGLRSRGLAFTVRTSAIRPLRRNTPSRVQRPRSSTLRPTSTGIRRMLARPSKFPMSKTASTFPDRPALQPTTCSTPPGLEPITRLALTPDLSSRR